MLARELSGMSAGFAARRDQDPPAPSELHYDALGPMCRPTTSTVSSFTWYNKRIAVFTRRLCVYLW